MKKNSYLKIISLKRIDSTNTYALKLAECGQGEITVVRANQQTQGRGRMAKCWHSPRDKGIYVSFILRPPNPLTDLYFLPELSALAVVRILKESVPATIKMPNDIIVRSKKIAGVLVEAKSTNQHVEFVILGIGININSNKLELPSQATSLYIETGKIHNIELLTKRLIYEVIDIYTNFKKKNITRLLEESHSNQKTIDFL